LSFEFHPHAAHRWAPRRYQPIITRESSYAVLLDNHFGEWSVCSRFYRNGSELTAWIGLVGASDWRSHTRLVEAINAVKQAHSARHQRGGKFRVNEYGQVIVPTEAGGIDSAWCVGAVSGWFDFKDPLTNRLFDLRPGRLAPGDLWDKPLVGLRYTARADGTITFESHFEPDSRERLILRSPSRGLIEAGRRVRAGGYRVVVNDQRVALAMDESGARAHFLGTVDYSSWFEKEPCP
jgi:hypothetical protein